MKAAEFVTESEKLISFSDSLGINEIIKIKIKESILWL